MLVKVATGDNRSGFKKFQGSAKLNREGLNTPKHNKILVSIIAFGAMAIQCLAIRIHSTDTYGI